jgi:hypothetical protein
MQERKTEIRIVFHKIFFPADWKVLGEREICVKLSLFTILSFWKHAPLEVFSAHNFPKHFVEFS